jgi:hypothetical protein
MRDVVTSGQCCIVPLAMPPGCCVVLLLLCNSGSGALRLAVKCACACFVRRGGRNFLHVGCAHVLRARRLWSGKTLCCIAAQLPSRGWQRGSRWNVQYPFRSCYNESLRLEIELWDGAVRLPRDLACGCLKCFTSFLGYVVVFKAAASLDITATAE